MARCGFSNALAARLDAIHAARKINVMLASEHRLIVQAL
jgi:hypothetical protein